MELHVNICPDIVLSLKRSIIFKSSECLYTLQPVEISTNLQGDGCIRTFFATKQSKIRILGSRVLCIGAFCKENGLLERLKRLACRALKPIILVARKPLNAI